MKHIFLLTAGVMIFFCACSDGSSNVSDTTSPVAGNSGALTASSVSGTSLTLSWTAAADDQSPAAELEYLAYYSMADNLTSTADCEANGTVAGNVEANITSKNITGLTTSTAYYFNVIVQDSAGNKALYSTLSQATTATADTTAPTPGNSGTITAASVAGTSLTLNWTAATDNVTAAANLQYLAYYSTSNNLNSVANTEANGTRIDNYASNITTKNVTGLTGTTTYYFNVIVKDAAGNKALYSTLTQTTADATAPTAVNSGTITSTSVGSTSLTLNWTAATDNVTSAAYLQYLVYYSTSNNLNSVADTEANGTAIDSYASNITTKNVTGLTAGTTYYFNVIVKDQAGNKTLYSTLTQTISAATASIPIETEQLFRRRYSALLNPLLDSPYSDIS